MTANVTIDREAAIRRIHDVIRIVSICAGALDCDREHLVSDVRDTLDDEAINALWDVMEALGENPRGHNYAKAGGVE